MPVLPNKTGFDTDSEEWNWCQSELYEILKPHIRELLNQREEETVSREEKKRVSAVRDKMIEAMRKLTDSQGSDGQFSESRGRKSPEPRPVPPKPVLNPRGPRDEPNNPRTSPPPSGKGVLKRLGGMPPWRIGILDPVFRSEWVEENSQRVLVINKTFPLYEKWEGHELYIAETAAFELAKPEGDEKPSLEEYLADVDRLMSAFCKVGDE